MAADGMSGRGKQCILFIGSEATGSGSEAAHLNHDEEKEVLADVVFQKAGEEVVVVEAAGSVMGVTEKVRELAASGLQLVVLHLSSHGTTSGVLLEGWNTSSTSLAGADTFGRMLGPVGTVPLVVLSACDSYAIGQQLAGAGVAEHVIVTRCKVEDGVALRFSEHLYRMLLSDRVTLQDAFDMARDAADAVGVFDLLHFNIIADPDQTMFVTHDFNTRPRTLPSNLPDLPSSLDRGIAYPTIRAVVDAFRDANGRGLKRLVALLGDEPGVGVSTRALLTSHYFLRRSHFFAAGVIWVPCAAINAWLQEDGGDDPLAATSSMGGGDPASVAGGTPHSLGSVTRPHRTDTCSSSFSLAAGPHPYWRAVAEAIGFPEAVSEAHLYAGLASLVAGRLLLVLDDTPCCECMVASEVTNGIASPDIVKSDDLGSCSAGPWCTLRFCQALLLRCPKVTVLVTSTLPKAGISFRRGLMSPPATPRFSLASSVEGMGGGGAGGSGDGPMTSLSPPPHSARHGTGGSTVIRFASVGGHVIPIHRLPEVEAGYTLRSLCSQHRSISANEWWWSFCAGRRAVARYAAAVAPVGGAGMGHGSSGDEPRVGTDVGQVLPLDPWPVCTLETDTHAIGALPTMLPLPDTLSPPACTRANLSLEQKRSLVAKVPALANTRGNFRALTLLAAALAQRPMYTIDPAEVAGMYAASVRPPTVTASDIASRVAMPIMPGPLTSPVPIQASERTAPSAGGWLGSAPGFRPGSATRADRGGGGAGVALPPSQAYAHAETREVMPLPGPPLMMRYSSAGGDPTEMVPGVGGPVPMPAASLPHSGGGGGRSPSTPAAFPALVDGASAYAPDGADGGVGMMVPPSDIPVKAPSAPTMTHMPHGQMHVTSAQASPSGAGGMWGMGHSMVASSSVSWGGLVGAGAMFTPPSAATFPAPPPVYPPLPAPSVSNPMSGGGGLPSWVHLHMDAAAAVKLLEPWAAAGRDGVVIFRGSTKPGHLALSYTGRKAGGPMSIMKVAFQWLPHGTGFVMPIEDAAGRSRQQHFPTLQAFLASPDSGFLRFVITADHQLLPTWQAAGLPYPAAPPMTITAPLAPMPAPLTPWPSFPGTGGSTGGVPHVPLGYSTVGYPHPPGGHAMATVPRFDHGQATPGGMPSYPGTVGGGGGYADTGALALASPPTPMQPARYGGSMPLSSTAMPPTATPSLGGGGAGYAGLGPSGHSHGGGGASGGAYGAPTGMWSGGGGMVPHPAGPPGPMAPAAVYGAPGGLQPPGFAGVHGMGQGQLWGPAGGDGPMGSGLPPAPGGTPYM